MAEEPEGEYEESLSMRAAAGEVFDFVRKVQNLPKYLPTTTDAQSQGQDCVRVQGEAQGHSYDSDGYLRSDPASKRLEWGADEGYYAGWMQIRDSGDGSTVTVHLSLRAKPGGSKGPSPEQVREGLSKSLDSIRNQVEGRGGKEEPSAAG
jgi:hypothetical protein